MSLLAPRRAVPSYRRPTQGEVAPLDTVITHDARRRITRPTRRREIVAVIEPGVARATDDGLSRTAHGPASSSRPPSG